MPILQEATQKKFFEVEPLDMEKFIKVNELQPVTNPIFFDFNGAPTPDGLLSNEIFGITYNDRANTFAYINLGGEWFINPVFYVTWKTLDRNVVKCVHGTSNFIISKEGYLEENSDGETGIEFLRKNIDRIRFKPSDAQFRKAGIEFMNRFKDRIFIKNYLVIPAYYRDVSTTEKYMGVGDINKLYAQLLMASNSLKEFDRYGLSLYDANKGRIQELLYNIFEYFTQGTINKVSAGSGMAKKFGIIDSAVKSKTTDYGSRLVISAPELKVENTSDMICDVDHAAIPLASTIANFFPYVLTYVRQFFENEYTNNSIRTVIDPKTKKQYKVKLKDVRIAFSDDVIKEEMDRFIHGIANRIRYIELPTEDKNIPFVHIVFKGRYVTEEELLDKSKSVYNASDIGAGIIERNMTWVDLFYMAAVEVTRDKMVLITRYPIDSCYNQFPCGIHVSSTVETEPLVVNGVLYEHYPKIREEDVNKNTTSAFVDTLNISNVYLESIGGDYDGDQTSVRGIYSIEANAELRDQLNSKRHFINLGGSNIMETTKEGAQALYNLTMNVNSDSSKFTDPEF